jgi:hypothetical protein
VGFEEESRRDYFLKRRRGFLIKVAFALSCSVHLTRTDPLSNFKSVSYGLSKIQICSKFKLVRFPQIEQERQISSQSYFVSLFVMILSRLTLETFFN